MSAAGLGRRLSRALRRVKALRRREVFEREMDEEMRFHLDLEIEDRIRQGLSPEEARRGALRDFGRVGHAKEDAREARGLRFWDELLQDLRFGQRMLRRRPGFTAVAVLTLAIGIGSTTTIFSLTNAVLFRPVPGVHDQDRLAQVRFRAPHLEDEETSLSELNLRDLQAIAIPAVTHLVGWNYERLQVAAPGAATGLLDGAAVVGGYFEALGVMPSAGRLFSAAETAEGAAAPIVVISERARETLFGAGVEAVGRTLLINGVYFTVAGVAANGFRGVLRGGDADLWYPYPLHRTVRHLPIDFDPPRGIGSLGEFFVRLAPDATPATAELQLREAMARLVEAHPDQNERYAEYRPTLFSGFGLDPWVVDRTRGMALLLLGAVSLVLLIACANVANLLIFHGIRRRGESAVRQAVGASSFRLMRQHLTESCLLAVGGTALGLIAAWWLASLFAGLSLRRVPPLETIPIDWRVAAFAAAAGGATVLLSGLAPAVVVHRIDLSRSLKEASRTDTGRKLSLRSGLTIVQISLSLTLLVATLLLGRSARNLLGVELGYDPSGVVEAMLTPDPQGYSEEQANQFQRELLAQAALIPGAETVGVAVYGPLKVSFRVDLRSEKESTDQWPVEAYQDLVSPDYFSTIGVPLLAGRSFTLEEIEASWRNASDAIVVNETLARRLFGSVGGALGRNLVQRGYRENTTLRVVGVVRDFRTRGLGESASPDIFRPLGEHYSNELTLLVRSARPPEEVVESVRSVVDRLDPALPLYQAAPLSDRVLEATREQRFLAALMSVLAIVATLLGGIGLYGIVAYSVAERTREIGVRVALGARGIDVVGLVMRQSLALAAAGVVVGSLTAWAMARLLRSRLFGVEPLDPATWLVAIGFFAVVALLAAAGPARTASSIDPVRALKV